MDDAVTNATGTMVMALSASAGNSAAASVVVLPPVSPVAVAPGGGSLRMFVAPVDRLGSGPRTFDPARQGRFNVSTPPLGWFAMGSLPELERTDDSSFAELWSGAPAAVSTRARGTTAATVRCTFAAWSKLAMALSSGSQQMNLLRTAQASTPAAGGGTPATAPLLGGSSETVLRVPVAFKVAAGDVVAVDEDYAGETGYLGSPVANAFVSDPARVSNDRHYLRRITFNLGLVTAVAPDPSASATVQLVTLAAPLPAGLPSATMQLGVVQGFVDRVGGSLLSEWSALFVVDGVAGDRILLHYPRLQVAPGATERRSALATGLERWQLCAHFVALPVTDTVDGDAVVCYRSYLPAPGRTP